MQSLEQFATDPLAKKILQVLAEAPAKVAFEKDLRLIAKQVTEECGFGHATSGRMVGRLYQKVRQQLSSQQVVECVRVWDSTARTYRDALCSPGAHMEEEVQLALQDGPSDSTGPGAPSAEAPTETPRTSRGSGDEAGSQCAGLAAPEAGAGAAVDRLAVPSGGADCGGLAPSVSSGCVLRVRERPLGVQGTDLIECSGFCGVEIPGVPPGYQGLSSTQVQDYLGMPRKGVEWLLAELLRRRKVVKVLESHGKTHVNWYVHERHAMGALAAALGDGAAAPAAGLADSSLPCRGGVRPPRLHATFERRVHRTMALVEELGVVMAGDVRRAQETDTDLRNSNTTIDRKSSLRILEDLARRDERVGIVRTDGGEASFVYWAPRMSEASAQLHVDTVKQRLREEVRRKKIDSLSKGKQLAIADGPQVLALADAPLAAEQASQEGRPDEASHATRAPHPPAARRRRLLQDVLPRPGLPAEDTRRDQVVRVFYGWVAPVMARVQLLHGFLLRRLGLSAGTSWSASQIVDEMDLQVFLQVVGCETQDARVDDLLRGEGFPRLGDLPPDVRAVLHNRTYSGASRSALVVRRLMAHLVKLRLARLSQQPRPGLYVTVALNHKYELQRHAALHAMTLATRGGVSDDPPVVGSFDFAESTSFSRYWEQLKGLANAWISQMSGDQEAKKKGAACEEAAVSEPSCDDGGPEVGEGRGGGGGGGARVPLPHKYGLAELFRRKNWKGKGWLTPHQRTAIDDFYRAVMANPCASGGRDESQATVPAVTVALRTMTPRSQEVVALSQRVGVPPDQIVKYCVQQTEITRRKGADADTPKRFSMLFEVRYQCHLCGHACFQLNSIEDHYRQAHEEDLPEDERLYYDPEFLVHRDEAGSRQGRAAHGQGQARSTPAPDGPPTLGLGRG
ncbi:unnamed protein product [Prorocentrum cordatum]|nr:unnamed protein product [Polarella glacialis]